MFHTLLMIFLFLGALALAVLVILIVLGVIVLIGDILIGRNPRIDEFEREMRIYEDRTPPPITEKE